MKIKSFLRPLDVRHAILATFVLLFLATCAQAQQFRAFKSPVSNIALEDKDGMEQIIQVDTTWMVVEDHRLIIHPGINSSPKYWTMDISLEGFELKESYREFFVFEKVIEETRYQILTYMTVNMFNEVEYDILYVMCEEPIAARFYLIR